MNNLNSNESERTPFDFLAYLRGWHCHFRTIQPQTAHAINERRRYATIYRDMRRIESLKHNGVGR